MTNIVDPKIASVNANEWTIILDKEAAEIFTLYEADITNILKHRLPVKYMAGDRVVLLGYAGEMLHNNIFRRKDNSNDHNGM